MPSLPETGAAPGGGPRASVLGAFLEGWRRALAAPAITCAVLLTTLAVALPLAVALDRLIETQLGSSLMASRVHWDWDEGWAAEVRSHSSGVGRTFTREILGFGGTLATADHVVDGDAIDPSIAGPIAAYIVFWVFLSGGVIDRFARARPVRARAFFAACGVNFLRFLRLAIVIGPCYWVLFRWVRPLLFATTDDRLLANQTVEHVAFAVHLGLYAVFLSAIGAVSLVADLAKVRVVVEDRHSAIGALGAALRFVGRRPWRMAALYLVNIAAALVIARVWMQAAEPAWGSNWAVLLVSQLYLVARIWAKLAFIASEVAFFQGELAHAGYTAAPRPIWPDSPAVEAIRNLR